MEIEFGKINIFSDEIDFLFIVVPTQYISTTLKKLKGGLSTRGQMYQRFIFPIYNEYRQIIGFAGRDMINKEGRPKWKHIGKKTKWLNILHAGWPGGLVLGGLLTIGLGEYAAKDWRILVWLIAIPAIIFLVMLIKANFPVNERVASGTSYKEMLAEFGALGALLAGGLIFGQLGLVLGWGAGVTWGLVAAATIGYGVY